VIFAATRCSSLTLATEWDSASPASGAAFTGYPHRRCPNRKDIYSGNTFGELRKAASGVPFARSALPACTKSCHPPVDGLHSIENKSDADAYFLLTSKSEGVQLDRSLTVS
jgi:hypothetical protein